MTHEANSEYFKTNDELVGVVMSETKTQLTVQFDGWSAKFMKVSGKQVGTPRRWGRRVNLQDV